MDEGSTRHVVARDPVVTPEKLIMLGTILELCKHSVQEASETAEFQKSESHSLWRYPTFCDLRVTLQHGSRPK